MCAGCAEACGDDGCGVPRPCRAVQVLLRRMAWARGPSWRRPIGDTDTAYDRLAARSAPFLWPASPGQMSPWDACAVASGDAECESSKSRSSTPSASSSPPSSLKTDAKKARREKGHQRRNQALFREGSRTPMPAECLQNPAGETCATSAAGKMRRASSSSRGLSTMTTSPLEFTLIAALNCWRVPSARVARRPSWRCIARASCSKAGAACVGSVATFRRHQCREILGLAA